MRQIDSYEQFCKAFESDDEELKKEAKLLLFIQNWIIRILDYMEEDTLDYSLKIMVEQISDKMSTKHIFKDALSNIVDDSDLAFRHLNENMREKIIRENVQMPVYKVREINSYGLNWLSRQSGRTIRQKVSSAGNSIMAVQRRMSLDTAENRLFVAFAKEIFERLNTKLESLGKIDPRQIAEEEDMAVFLRRDDIAEVRRWENLPPNNTLLSDQNYKKIWHAWNEMKKMDERVRNDSDYIGNRLATIFFVELIVYFKDTLRIPQTPVEVDYNEYNVYMCEKQLSCLDKDGNTVVIKKENNRIYLKSVKKDIEVEFKDNNVVIRVNKEEDKEYEITQNEIYTYVNFIATKLEVETSNANTIVQRKDARKFKNIVVDLFSLHPGYIGDDLSYKKLSERILQQKYTGNDIDGDEKNYYIPCDNSNAIKMISGVTDTYTIPFAVDNGSMEQMKRLVHMMENYIVTDSFTYVFPDAYNELQLSMVHKAARMVYRKVRSVPLSIGAVFKYQTTESFRKYFKPGDFLLVVNLIDDEVTFTLVASEHDKRLESKVGDYKGIVWERHPTSTTLFKDKIDNNVVDLLTKAGCVNAEKIYKLLGLDGLCDEVDKLSVFFGNEWFQITPEIRRIVERFKLNITDAVTEFLRRNRSVVQRSNVYVVSLVDNLIYKGIWPFYYIGKQEVLEGCKELERLEQLTDIPLWRDYLPALAIKLMYGKFDLIKNARVEPRFEEKQNIPIMGTFTLPKKCKEYHFNLVQDENARKMQYEAVIKNPAFPLNRDVECDLVMTYQYGAEEPYELVFVPKESKTAGFSEAKVKWFRLEKYDTEDLKAPDFPAKIPWAELYRYPGRKGDLINVFDVLENEFKLLNEGYYTFDISDTFMKQDKNGMWYGEFVFEKGGEDVKVQWSQKDWDRDSAPPQIISEISCWVVPDVSGKRYRISNLWNARTRDILWFKNRNGGYQCIVNFDYDGEMKTIAVIDRKFDMPDRFHTGINDITFEVRKLSNGNLQAVNIHDEDGPKRYRISNLLGARTRDYLWFKNRYGAYQCIVNFDYDGEMETIAIIDQKFDMPDRFHTGINDITFEVRRLPNGNLQAVNIHDEEGSELKKFKAINICEGGKTPVPPRFFTNAYYGKWTRTLFANNRSLAERECPSYFQKSFVKSVNNWVNLFYQYREPNDKKELFELLSLAARDIGKDYYELAYEVLEMYRRGKLDIPYEIGCAFCDLSNNMQKELMKSVLSEVAEDYKAIGILAKAIWHNEQFVYNADLDLLLNTFLPKAVDYIGGALYRSEGGRVLRKDLENVKYCLEYILGIMRLRNLNESMITDKYLSLNNPKMQELYKYLEVMVDNNTKIFSFLKLEITSKGAYEKISDLLYVLLVYVTGYNTEGEIRISLNIDD